MPRKRQSKSSHAAERSTRTPASVKLVTALLVVLAVGGAAGVRYLRSPSGAVFLVDHGAVVAYARVQRDLTAALKQALETKGLRRHIRVVRASAETAQHDVDAARRIPAVWDIPCDESTDLLRVNVALTEAVEAAGALVRRSEETDGGRTLLFDVGTHSVDTHRLTLRRVAPEVIARELPPPEKLPKLALVIDDFGYTKGGIPREILDLDLPLSIAILPKLRHSRDVLDLARKKNRCVLLHLPMEGTEGERVDVAPVKASMSDAEIGTLVSEYVESLPGIDGVNNHQGSLATADYRAMKTVMASLSGRGLFFLDSLTSPNSLAYNAAVDAGLRAARNAMFLDDATERRDDVEARLHQLVELARAQGAAVGIGHPHPWTFEALRDNLDYLESAGVELVTVCELVEWTAAADSTR
jgi:polysaccharide deacetylase 2 family uncharacterized protein YibQ